MEIDSDVVLRLDEPIYQLGRNITADIWFTILELIRQLRIQKLFYVGNTRKNKIEPLYNFVLPRQGAEFSSIFVSYVKE